MLKSMTLRSAFVACLWAISVSAFATADAPEKIDVPAGEFTAALQKLAEITGVEFVYSAEQLQGMRTHGVHGEYTTEQAVTQLLEGTTLRIKIHESGAMLISDSKLIVPQDGALEVAADPLLSSAVAGGAAHAKRSDEGSDTSLLQRTHLAQADQASSRTPATSRSNDSSAQNSDSSKVQLEQVIVTAQKRSEKLMDVPSSVSAIRGDRLESLQVSSLSDLAGYVPGLAINANGSPGHRAINIRGLATSYVTDGLGPLVATYVDDVAIGSSTATARGNLWGLDLLPYDIERVEVLMGPQGTLYGSNAMGGLIKYALHKPDLTQLEVRGGGSLQVVDGGGSPDWTVRAAVNLPIAIDKLALRLSGFDQTTSGYIDNVGTGVKDANHSVQNGGRAVLLWKPTERLAIQATLLYQNINTDDLTIVTVSPVTREPIYGPQVSNTYFPEPFTQRTRIYAVNANWDLDFATLSSTSGWSELESLFEEDVTIPYGQFVPGRPDSLARFDLSDHIKKFVQEVRLASAENQRLQWMLGGYFTREAGGEDAGIPSFTSSHVALPLSDSLLIANGQNNVYKEKAAFGNLIYKLTERFDIGAGSRYSSYSEFSCPGFSGGFFGSNSTLPCFSLPSQGVSTWMANARFHLNQDVMLYARVATGYRPGFRCANCPSQLAPEAPSIVQPDKTKNYELGIKGELLDRRLQLTISAFDIDWQDIQIQAFSPSGGVYTSNASTARSTGFEFTAASQVFRGLRVNSTLAYTDARLTRDAPLGVGGKDGDQLPSSPKWAGSLAADYSRPVGEDMSLLIGGSYRYRDMIVSQFSEASSAGSLPARPQNIGELYTGIEFKKAQLRLYGKNVFNNRSFSGLSYGPDQQAVKFVPTQPRTIGFSVDIQF